MPLLVDERMAESNSRLSAIRLCMFTLRAMENWREIVDDCEKVLIFIAVIAIGSERFTRGEDLEEELKNIRADFPEERLRACNVSSVAAATGLNRETTRRKVNELIDAGLLIRTLKGQLRSRRGSLPKDHAIDIARRQLEAFVRVANDLMRDGVITLD